jgi:hypothetical protein
MNSKDVFRFIYPFHPLYPCKKSFLILCILSILFEFQSYIFVPPRNTFKTSPAIGASG